jgi:mRNA degradation ribonuclease J1/J2
VDQIVVVEPRPATVEVGPFKVQFVPVSHSIPESSALVIDTPAGRIFHSADFKIDHTPGGGRRLGRCPDRRDRGRTPGQGDDLRFHQRLFHP